MGEGNKNWLVIGAGLAGALVARQAVGCGVQVTICDPSSGSNAPPGGILHPYPGRRYVQNPLEVEAFDYAQRFYEALAEESGVLIKMRLPVVRPTEASLLKNDSVTVEKFDRKYCNQAEIKKLWPILNVSSGAFTYNSGMVLDVQALVNTILSETMSAGARLIPFFATCLERRGDGWYAKGEFGEVGPYGAVVCAIGSEHTQLLACRGASRNFGTLALYSSNVRDEEFQFIVSSRGHFAPLPGGGYVVGSTYIHLDEMGAVPQWNDADEVAHLEGIGKRLIRPDCLVGDRMGLWRGSRATVPQDKQPIVGLLTRTADPGLWMIGGLASRGLFWAPWLARSLVGAMLQKSVGGLPDAFAPTRLKGFEGARYESRAIFLCSNLSSA